LQTDLQVAYVSKIAEWVIGVRFISYANTSQLLLTYQSTYQQHHNTEAAILSVYNDLVHAVGNGKVTILVLLNLGSAFDTVDPDILLSVLRGRFSVEDTAFN